MELMGRQEIANMLDVSHQRVDQLIKRRNFPKPVAVLAMGQIWLAEDIHAWARENRD